ncbi:MAG: ThuA domain-containing protein [Gemmataceae bacterium]|nr:ThuA domain-containing protein [Gemmataceae bacterium]
MKRPILLVALALVIAVLLASGPTASSQNQSMIEKVIAALPESAPAKPKAKRKILIYSKTNGFRHGSIVIGAKALIMMGDKTGAYLGHHTEDESFFEPEKLKTFDAVFMLNTTGDCLRGATRYVDEKDADIPGAKEAKVDQKLIAVDAKGKEIEGAKIAKIDGKDVVVDANDKPIPDAKVGKTGGRNAIVDAKGQEIAGAKKIPPDAKAEEALKAALADFVASGKGLAGCHSATDTYGGWKAYNQMMGGTFAGHPWTQKIPVKNQEPKHPLNAAFDGKDFEINDEIYQFRADTALPSDRKFLLSMDTAKMSEADVKKGGRKDGLYPISWVATYGKGRTFYCSLGHREEIFWNPVILKHYLAGIQYVLGDLEAEAPAAKVVTSEK